MLKDLIFCNKIVCSTVIGKKLSKVCYKGCYFCNKDIFFHDVLKDDCLDFPYSFCEPWLNFFLEKLVFLDLHYTDRKFIILPRNLHWHLLDYAFFSSFWLLWIGNSQLATDVFSAYLFLFLWCVLLKIWHHCLL